MSSAADCQLQEVAPDQNEDTAIRFRIGHDLELLLHVMGYPEIFGLVVHTLPVLTQAIASTANLTS